MVEYHPESGKMYHRRYFLISYSCYLSPKDKAYYKKMGIYIRPDCCYIYDDEFVQPLTRHMFSLFYGEKFIMVDFEDWYHELAW